MDKMLRKKLKSFIERIVEYSYSEAINPIFNDFVQNIIEEYEDTDSMLKKKDRVLSSFLFDYVLVDDKRYLDLFIEGNSDLTSEEINIAKNFKNGIISFFEVKRIGKDFFEAYSLLNEKNYTIKTIENFLDYKSIGKGSYLHGRILPFDDFYFFYEFPEHLPISSKRLVLKISSMILTQQPSVLVKDNPEKLIEIQKKLSNSHKNFIDLYGNNEIFSNGQLIDDLLKAFNSYNYNQDYFKIGLDTLQKKPDEFYFDPSIIDNDEEKNENRDYNYDCHDLGLIFDPSSGLNILPYYATFLEIFSNPNYKEIKGYDECVLFYLENDNIPPYPIEKVVKLFPQNARNVFADALEEEDFSIENDFDELIKEYKYDYYFNHRLSINTIFEESKTFKEFLVDFAKADLEEQYNEINLEDIDEGAFENIGRNDLCPCGSGKKFKKCCKDKFY